METPEFVWCMCVHQRGRGGEFMLQWICQYCAQQFSLSRAVHEIEYLALRCGLGSTALLAVDISNCLHQVGPVEISFHLLETTKTGNNILGLGQLGHYNSLKFMYTSPEYSCLAVRGY